jgi:hypothetical protein
MINTPLEHFSDDRQSKNIRHIGLYWVWFFAFRLFSYL